ncbi:MAG TPA: D-2-hydroxyacid dehydrogenase [Gemmatimonadaceae bacterium]
MSPRRLVVDLAATSRNWALPEWGERLLRQAAPAGWEVVVATSPTSSDGDGSAGPSPEVLEAIGGAEAYFGFGISRPLFIEARRLRWVHSAAAGVGSALFPEMRRSDVVLTNSAGVHAVPIAEYVLAGVLHFTRGFDIAIPQQRAGVWDKSPFTALDAPLVELGDCRVLIVGAGGIGRETACRMAPFGASVIGVRRRPALGAPEGFARVVGPDALDDELARADIVVLAAPATPDTEQLLTRGRLALLPRGAIVVNVARGSLLDEAALAEALRAGRLRGAVLDVFQREPLAAESPLWQLPNVLLTPHVAPVSPAGFWRRELALFVGNWEAYVLGEPLRNLVDKQAGY